MMHGWPHRFRVSTDAEGVSVVHDDIVIAKLKAGGFSFLLICLRSVYFSLRITGHC